MMRGIRPLILAFIVVTLTTSLAEAQWTKTVQGLLGPISTLRGGTHEGSGGAMCYRDQHLWAGFTSLWMSTDQGITWQKAPFTFGPKEFVTDIDFYDQLTGLVTTDSGGLYLTTDGGSNWKRIYAGQYNFSARFAGTAQDIIAILSDGVAITHDAGASWKALPPTVYGSSMTATRNGIAHVLATDLLAGDLIFHTTDTGKTWDAVPSSLPFDSWSVTTDSCNPDELFILNEGYWAKQKTTNVFYSPAGDSSWQTLTTYPTPYFAGAIALGKQAIYCPTISNGILRSSNLGKSWTSVGGPPSFCVDSRLIAVVSDNIVVAIDTDGSVWRTTNGGGSPIPSLGGRTALLSDSSLFELDTLSPCDSPVVRTAILWSQPCARMEVRSEQIVGPDAGYFTILRSLDSLLTGADSITFSFRADSSRSYNAIYTVELADGTVVQIALGGTGKQTLRVLSVDTTALFATDTVRLCDAALQQSVLVKWHSCLPLGVTSIRITGPDSAYYHLAQSLPQLLHPSDTLLVNFKPDSLRSYHALLTIVFDDGTIRTIRLLGTGAPSPAVVAWSPTMLFDSDSLSVCDPAITRVAKLFEGSCTEHRIVSQLIAGRDSLRYQILHSAASDTDSVAIVFTPDSAGPFHATYVAVLDDSTTIAIPLGGVGKPIMQKLAMLELTPFRFDTISPCDQPVSRVLSILDSSCIPWAVSSVHVAGPDSLDFTILRGLDSVLHGRDSVTILFDPHTSTAMHTAELLIRMANDSVFRVPLMGFAKPPVRSLAVTPSSLFSGDSVSLCGNPRIEQLVLHDSSCLPWRVLSVSISGADSANYRIVNGLDSVLHGEDTVTVAFLPDQTRAYHAALSLVLEDGTTETIPLLGVGEGASHLSLISASISQAALGELVRVPIRIAHTADVPPLTMALHYDTTSLVYRGSFSVNGAPLDIAANGSNGRSLLHLDSLIGSDTTEAYALFAYYPLLDTCTSITLDSLSFEAGSTACALVDAGGASIDICTPYFCGQEILSRYLRYRTMPEFTVMPNPTSSTVTLTARNAAGQCEIAVIDHLGIVRQSVSHDFSKLDRTTLDLSEFAEGTYFICITAGGITSTIPIVRK